jgi:hypothetical protein
MGFAFQQPPSVSASPKSGRAGQGLFSSTSARPAWKQHAQIIEDLLDSNHWVERTPSARACQLLRKSTTRLVLVPF